MASMSGQDGWPGLATNTPPVLAFANPVADGWPGLATKPPAVLAFANPVADRESTGASENGRGSPVAW